MTANLGGTSDALLDPQDIAGVGPGAVIMGIKDVMGEGGGVGDGK
jgi:hypothetical protein